MNRIERYSNWGYWDALGGVALNHGERILVKWPSGETQDVSVVVVDTGVQTVSCWNVDSRAFVEIQHNGVKVMAPIVGLMARRLS